MSIDQNCRSRLNFGLLWQRSKGAKSPIDQLFPYLVLIYRITGEGAKQNLKKLRNYSLWTCCHIMVVSRSQDKNTDYFFISA